MTKVIEDFQLARNPYSLSEALSRYSVTQPQTTAINDGFRKTSYSDLERQVCDIVNHLASVGLRAGSVIWSLLPRSIGFVSLFLAAQRLQAILVPLSTKVSAASVNELRNHISPAAIVYDVELAKPSASALEVLNFQDVAHDLTNGDLGIQLAPQLKKTLRSAGDIAAGSYINFTSGTTAPSKGAICSPANIFWNTRAATHQLNLKPTDVHFSTFPVHIHPHELFARAMYLGGTAILMDFPLVCSDLNQINDLGVTCLMSTPALLAAILRIQCNEGITFRTVKVTESGGGVTPAALIRGWQQQNQIAPTPVWGSAETTGIALVNTSPLDNALLLEPITPYYSAELVQDGSPNMDAWCGELRLKGPAIVQSYVSHIPATERQFRTGWFYTGDIFRIVSESKFLFEHRANDAIKPKGMTVFPGDVESCLQQIDGVRDAVVVGIQHQTKGEILAAAVVFEDTCQQRSVRRIRKVANKNFRRFPYQSGLKFWMNYPAMRLAKSRDDWLES